MHKFYCDDSAFKKNQNSENRPVFLYGGILISREDEIELSNRMKIVKKEYTSEDMPFKYNIKDVEEVYQRFDKINDFKSIKSNSLKWRTALIQESLQFDYGIFISCIENFQAEKKEQKEIRSDLSAFLFSNTLMRVGLFSKEKGLDYVQVILDWPTAADPKPFDKEYYSGYNKGSNSNGLKYYSGPLKNLNFDQTLYYARCNHSNMLQLTDIIMGATRDWMEKGLQKLTPSVGQGLSKQFFHKFYHYPQVWKHGINISSKNGMLNLQISTLITEMLSEN